MATDILDLVDRASTSIETYLRSMEDVTVDETTVESLRLQIADLEAALPAKRAAADEHRTAMKTVYAEILGNL